MLFLILKIIRAINRQAHDFIRGFSILTRLKPWAKRKRQEFRVRADSSADSEFLVTTMHQQFENLILTHA